MNWIIYDIVFIICLAVFLLSIILTQTARTSKINQRLINPIHVYRTEKITLWKKMMLSAILHLPICCLFMCSSFPLSFHAETHNSDLSVANKGRVAWKYEKKSGATSKSSVKKKKTSMVSFKTFDFRHY